MAAGADRYDPEQRRFDRLVFAALIPIVTILIVWMSWRSERTACELARSADVFSTQQRDCGAIGGDEVFPVALSLIVGGIVATWSAMASGAAPTDGPSR